MSAATLPEIRELIRPSSSHRWIPCPASVLESYGITEEASDNALEGRIAAKLAEDSFKEGDSPADHPTVVLDGQTIEVTKEMQEKVGVYVETVRTMAGRSPIQAEREIGHMAYGMVGTADAVVLEIEKGELQVHDLKYGRRVVKAEDNHQLLNYADGLCWELDDMMGIVPAKIRLVIHQPNLGVVDEFECNYDYIRAFRERVITSACRVQTIMQKGEASEEDYRPSEKVCRWCPGKAKCKALERACLTIVLDDDPEPVTAERVAGAVGRIRSSDNDHLAMCYGALPMIEMWAEAVAKEMYKRMADGQDVPGYKLVQGKQGARFWTDPEEAAKKMKGQRLKDDQMYEKTLISPTKYEKIVDDKRYKKLLPLIGRKEPGLVVASIDDRREAVTINKEVGFEDLDGGDLI